MVSEFHDIRDPRTGGVLRRTPLCDRAVAGEAVAAATAALPEWSACGRDERLGRLAALADALEAYREHVAHLLAEEGGTAVELDAVVALLRDDVGIATASAGQGGARVVGLASTASEPLLSAWREAVPALRNGSTVVVVTHPSAPSALVALAELAGRCGLPAGVINVIHGDAALTEAVRAEGAAASR